MPTKRAECDECPSCGADTALILSCDNCYRNGCVECMPGGPGVWCEDCDDGTDPNEETDRCHETQTT